jgi:ribonucleoside-diphosphate reductase alpha chain
MGYADMLLMMNMKYDSDEAVKFADQLMNFINKEAYKASMQLGKEKGNFPIFDQSVFSASKSKSHKVTKCLRNATRTTIAPTGTISIIAGCSSGIEPIFSFDYKRESNEGVDLSQVHPLYKQAMDANGGKLPKHLHAIYVSAGEIDPEWHIKTLHAFQMHTDNSCSKTVNLPSKTAIKEIKRIYEWAWKLGLKGITIFRDGCKKGKQVLYHKMQECPQCKKMTLKPGENCWTCVSCGYSKCDIQ